MTTSTPKITLDCVDTYNRLYGLTTRHPLAAVIDLKEATRIVNHVEMHYGVYALFLKNGANCVVKYGRREYDCTEGSVVSFAPGQTIGVHTEVDEVRPDVIGIMFHPDLIYGTPLGEKIGKYHFFDYSEQESLHLSQPERDIFMECIGHIRREVEYPIDSHSADLIASHIQVLLDYLNRFYERQLITRHRVNSNIITTFEKSLREYFESGKGIDGGVPSVRYFAEKVSLTPGYFGDLVKKETALSAQEFITSHIVTRARRLLASTSDDVSVIAYSLGFQHPQHFSRMFKKATGLTPSQFRARQSR